MAKRNHDMSKKENLGDLITYNKENAEKLSAADKKVASDKYKIEKTISKLILENKQNAEKLYAAYKIINTQKKEIKNQAADLIRANKEKAKRKADLVIAKKELAHKAKLFILNKKLLLANEQEKLAKEKYIELYNFAPTGYFTLSREGKIIELNLFATQILGKERSFLKEQFFGNFVSDDTKSIFNHFLEQVFKSKTKQICDVTLLTDSDLPKYVYISGIVIKNAEQCLITINDITERKHAENVLHESEEKYSRVFMFSPYSITITSIEESKFIEVNDAFTRISGFTREEGLANSAVGLNIWVDIEEQKWVESILLDGKDVTGKEFLFRKKNGEIITGLFSAKIIKINNKQCVLSSVNDITEIKQTESELIKAKNKAEESDHLKSAFLANMSHEIRTPLNGILGFAELLKEPNISSDDQQDYIQTIQISGARMLNTINSIVDVSKIESGLTKVDIKDTNINEKIEFTYKFFKQEVEIKGLQFLFKNGLPTNEAIIKTDNEKIYAILTNLVRNAIKFTFDGSIEFGYEKKGEYLEFYVKDTGIGIPQKQQQLIFERFRQGSESYNRGYEGSGLGLSICKSYVEMLGGKIWVESDEGKGSTFYFTIPYNAVSEEKIELLYDVSAEHKEIQIKNLKILIVEDDEISYSILARTIRKISKEVLHAITGVQAVEICRNNPDLDLVLMDIRMSNMDGMEATRQIRQFNKDVIIIAQTAYAFAGDSEKAIEAGCNDYISKPINKTLLYELIKKRCNK
jgi:PAS domain S-box-containing protein